MHCAPNVFTVAPGTGPLPPYAHHARAKSLELWRGRACAAGRPWGAGHHPKGSRMTARGGAPKWRVVRGSAALQSHTVLLLAGRELGGTSAWPASSRPGPPPIRLAVHGVPPDGMACWVGGADRTRDPRAVARLYVLQCGSAGVPDVLKGTAWALWVTRALRCGAGAVPDWSAPPWQGCAGGVMLGEGEGAPAPWPGGTPRLLPDAALTLLPPPGSDRTRTTSTGTRPKPPAIYRLRAVLPRKQKAPWVGRRVGPSPRRPQRVPPPSSPGERLF